MNITTIGIDLAKSCIQVHCVDVHGKRLLNKKLKREQVVPFFSNRPACLIGMEACGSAHYWASKLQGLGHTVKLMAPQFVKPYVKTNKNDAADAEAICEAVSRPNMRFVPIKNSEQLAVLAMHRARQGFVKARTAQANQLRGLLAEHGIIIPKGIRHINQHLPDILEAGDNGLPGRFRQLLDRLSAHFKELDKQVRELDVQLQSWHQDSSASQKLAKIPGIGPTHRQCTGCYHRRCQTVSERPAVGSLAGVGAQATLQRRQANTAGDQQARRYLSAHPTHPWRPRRAAGGEEQGTTRR